MSGIMSLALLLAAAAVLCGLPPAAANVDAADASWLFSMGAEWAKVTGSPATNKWTAVLSGVPAYALAFTDRPNHVAKYVAVDRMLGTYANPPNAALAYIDAAGAHRQVTVMITSAAWASARKTSITLAFAVVPADRAGQPVPPQQAAGALTGLGCKAGAGGSMTCELRKPWLFIDNVSNPGTACAACTTNSQCNSGYCCTTTGQGNQCSSSDGGTTAGKNIGCQLSGSTYNCCDSGGNPNLLCGSSCGCSSNYYCSSGSCIPSCTPRPGRPCK